MNAQRIKDGLGNGIYRGKEEQAYGAIQELETMADFVLNMQESVKSQYKDTEEYKVYEKSIAL